MEDAIMWIVAGLIALISWAWEAYKQRRDKEALPESRPEPAPPEADWDDLPTDDPDPHHLPEVARDPVRAEPAPPAEARSMERIRVANRLDGLRKDAEVLLEVARVDWSTMRIARTIEEFVLPRTRRALAEVDRVAEDMLWQLQNAATELEQIYGVIKQMIEQRRHPRIGKDLADVDAMAAGCYQPIIDYAQAGGIRLTSSTPVAMLQKEFDLGIWTGFIPTGIAPIFLPSYFLERVAWWPALAHEVAHDFFAASPGAEDAMRMQLGLPSEEVGVQFVSIGAEGLTFAHLAGVFGGWFEELFCDVFGTLMIGPAYGYTMIELFSSPQDPQAVVRVGLEAGGGQLDPHPPRHLRLRTVARVLELVGEDAEAHNLRAEWAKRHGEVATMELPLRGGGTASVPLSVMEELAEELATRLYSEQMYGLDGHAMYAIPGLDYGPHEAAEVRRARDELLRGEVPGDHRARFVIGGVVLAWRQARHRERELVELAHRAIVGVTEHHHDIHDHLAEPGVAAPFPPPSTDDKREAFILHTVLGPPVAARFLARARGVPVGRGLVEPRHRQWRS